MKDLNNILKKLVLVLTFALMSTVLMADPPNPNGGNGNGGGVLPGGGAPIGSGIALFVGLAAAYGAKKSMFAEEDKA
jgi:hypothetical protein